MCGIVGAVHKNLKEEEWQENLLRMTNTLIHRGPDDHGVWCDPVAGIGLGFRRLSIIDLSMEGHQPMASHCGRYMMVFNGEIYNYLEIKKELSSYNIPFKGTSDTEIFLAAISQWGLSRTLKQVNGMFAVALFDKKAQQLNLIRDRIGKKPLYYGLINKSLVFASELKAFTSYPGWTREVDRESLALLIRYNYIPSPYSIYTNFNKLQAGHVLSIDLDSFDLSLVLISNSDGGLPRRGERGVPKIVLIFRYLCFC